MIRSVLGDSTVWSTARSVTWPWQINPERESNSLMNVVSNGSISFSTPCPEMVNNNSTDSTCALSLLSNSNPIHTPTNIWPPSSAFDDSITTDRVTMAHSPPVSIHHQYLNQTWEFLADEKSNSQFMSHVLGKGIVLAMLRQAFEKGLGFKHSLFKDFHALDISWKTCVLASSTVDPLCSLRKTMDKGNLILYLRGERLMTTTKRK